MKSYMKDEKKNTHFIVLMKSVILLYTLALLQISSYAQVNSFNKDIIPPSPSSFVYKKIEPQAPSLVDGSVRLSIPLYNLVYSNISIPFSLEYHSNGIKVYDDPSPCGYGWIFSPGLRITRTIMGRPDEQYKWKTSSNGTMDDYTFLRSGISDDRSSIPNNSLVDTQHDIYNIILWNNHYTFILKRVDNQLKAITQGNNLKIIVYENPMCFEVTDENGTKYYFKDYTEYIDTPRYTTAWMLQKIILINGDNIIFEWEGYSHFINSGTQFGAYSLRDSQVLSLGGTGPTYTNSWEYAIMSRYGTYGKLQHLSHIKFPGGDIYLNYKTGGSPFIKKMSIKNFSGDFVNNINFSYGTASNDSCLLKNISFLNGDIYSFAYNEKYFDAKYAQDFWGYYNGKTNNRSLVPLIKLKTYYDNYQLAYSYQLYGDADRNIDSECMKANILTRVNYPTGGYSSFEYEPHRFIGQIPDNTEIENEYNKALNEGGGLRVAKITTKDNSSSEPIIRTYKYGKQESGLANSISEPTLDSFIDIYHTYRCNFIAGLFMLCGLRQVLFNTDSNYMTYNFNTSPIWYDEVTEYTDQGKTVYNFKSLVDKNNIYHEFGKKGITYYNTLFSKGPLLTSQTTYLKKGNAFEPMKRVDYYYRVDDKVPEENLLIRRSSINTFSCETGSAPDFDYLKYSSNLLLYTCAPKGYIDFPLDPNGIYESNIYYISFKFESLSKAKTTTYTSNGNIIEEMEYSYINNLLKTKQKIYNGDITDINTYLYPFDYLQMQDASQQNLLAQMTNLNQISTPFLITHTRNGAVTKQEIWFKNYGNSLILPEKEYYTKGNNAKECRVVYEYDPKGNIQTITRDGELKETYLWGYNWQYPVMKIEGINYSELKAQTGETLLASLNQNVNTTMPVCESIRNSVNSPALISSYIYFPLVGMLTSSDPGNVATQYAYIKNRLKSISDSKSKQIQSFLYSYYNDNFSVSFPSRSSYAFNENLSTTCTVSGGSGSFSYLWTLKDGSGKVLYTKNSPNSDLSISLSEAGNLQLICQVKDILTSKEAIYSSNFTVISEYITFRDIINKERCTSAHIICSNNIQVTFKLDCSMTGSGTFRIPGQEFIIEDSASTKSVTVNLSAGDNFISINIDPYSYGEIILGILKVIGEHGESGGGYISTDFQH